MILLQGIEQPKVEFDQRLQKSEEIGSDFRKRVEISSD